MWPHPTTLTRRLWRPILQQQQQRSKHSKTQVKRLYNQHPARIRVEQRMGIDKTPVLPDPPLYPPLYEPTFLPNGWCAPATNVDTSIYPFQVARTQDKPHDAVGFLPVYTHHRSVFPW